MTWRLVPKKPDSLAVPPRLGWPLLLFRYRSNHRSRTFNSPTPIVPINRRSTVCLLKGENRRQNVHDALMGIDREVRPALKRKKYVLIKPNLTSFTNQLAATHADAIRGILDYLAPQFKSPVVIAESGGGDAQSGYDNFKYTALAKEFPSLKVSLVDFNEEALFVPVGIITYDVHPQMIRVAKRLFDPDVFIIDAAFRRRTTGWR